MVQTKSIFYGVKITGNIPLIKKTKLEEANDTYDFFIVCMLDYNTNGNERYYIYLKRSLDCNCDKFEYNGWTFQNGIYIANWGESNTSFDMIDCEGECKKEYLSIKKGTAACVGLDDHIEDMIKGISRISSKYDTNAMFVLNSKRISFLELREKDSLSHYSSFITSLSRYLKEADTVIKATEENISTHPKDALCLPVLKSRIKEIIDEFSNYRVVFD